MRSSKYETDLILGRGGRQGEKGFALIATLLVFWVLTALGMLVFSVTTQDLRVSSRTVGERKAFTAAESGVHWLTQNFNPADLNSSVKSGVLVDSSPEGDPNTKYTIAAPPGGWFPTSGPATVSIAGYAQAGVETWGRQRYLAKVTGTNSGYNSTVQVDVGIGYGPVDISTNYR